MNRFLIEAVRYADDGWSEGREVGRPLNFEVGTFGIDIEDRIVRRPTMANQKKAEAGMPAPPLQPPCRRQCCPDTRSI